MKAYNISKAYPPSWPDRNFNPPTAGHPPSKATIQELIPARTRKRKDSNQKKATAMRVPKRADKNSHDPIDERQVRRASFWPNPTLIHRFRFFARWIHFAPNWVDSHGSHCKRQTRKKE